MSVPSFKKEADVKAMARLQAGDDLALNEIMDRWTPRIHAYLFRLLGNFEDAQDLTQETFVAVYSSSCRYRPTAKFSSWIFGIAANQARQRIRWRMRHPEVAMEEQKEENGSASLKQTVNQTPSTIMQASEKAQAVRRAIQSLPVAMREILLLAEYEELSHSEIAKIVRCSVKAVETRLYRARKLLADALSSYL